MFIKKKNAIWGRYPCCDLVNSAIRGILDGNYDEAVRDLRAAVIKSNGYFYEDVAKRLNLEER